jgi:hypothetical protein
MPSAKTGEKILALLRVGPIAFPIHALLERNPPPRQMSFRISNHAREELVRRGIALADVEAVLEAPGQIVE